MNDGILYFNWLMPQDLPLTKFYNHFPYLAQSLNMCRSCQYRIPTHFCGKKRS